MQVDPRFITASRPRTIWKKRRGMFKHYQLPIRIVPDGDEFQVQFQNEAGNWVIAPTPGGEVSMTMHVAKIVAVRVRREVFERREARV